VLSSCTLCLAESLNTKLTKILHKGAQRVLFNADQGLLSIFA